MTPALDTGRTAEEMRAELAALRVENEALRTANAQIADDDWEPHPSLFAKRGETIGHVVKPERYKALLAAEADAAHLRAENANLRDRVREAEKGAEAMRGALDQAEACLSIVPPRSNKAEYLRTLGVVRAALSPWQTSGNPANSAPSRLVQSSAARCTGTGNPCGTDTVMAGRQCPDDRWGGRCAHRIAEAAKAAPLPDTDTGGKS